MRNKVLVALVLIFSTSLVGCSIGDFFESKAKTYAAKKVGDVVEDQLAEKDRAEFQKRYQENKKAGIIYAGQKIGMGKLATIIENLDKENAEAQERNAKLAAEIREGNVQTLWERIGAILIAFLTAWLGRSTGKKKGASLPMKLLSVVINAVQREKDGANPAEGKPSILHHIKDEANIAGVRHELDAEVRKVIN